MTLKHKITKTLRKLDIIPICVYEGCNRIRINEYWIKYPFQPQYMKKYTGSLCPEHFEMALEINGLKRGKETCTKHL